VWLLDPLDGTSNFAAGIPFFSVSLALLREGEVQLGVVYDPSRDECFAAARGGGAFLNGEPLRPPCRRRR
jgi:myo-inositol-1(or 4)-monophosphatase